LTDGLLYRAAPEPEFLAWRLETSRISRETLRVWLPIWKRAKRYFA